MAIQRYFGACDVSAAVPIGNSRFFAAGSDEDCTLRVYDRSSPGMPVATIDLTAFLAPADEDETEADIEGAAELDGRIFWIGSHGRSKTGKKRSMRRRLFATTVEQRRDTVILRPSGAPYRKLVRDLKAAPALSAFALDDAARLKPEKPGGLNIEGLAATPEGDLLLGFRNPVPKGRALVVRVRNPIELIDSADASADIELGALLDLDNRGIRALEFVPALGEYLIIAGAFGDAPRFQLYRWSGKAEGRPSPIHVEGLADITPEELIVVRATGGRFDLHLFSDDGDKACKRQPLGKRSFRVLTTSLPL